MLTALAGRELDPLTLPALAPVPIKPVFAVFVVAHESGSFKN